MEESSDFNSAVARSSYEALKREMEWNDPACATSDLSLSPNDVMVGGPLFLEVSRCFYALVG